MKVYRLEREQWLPGTPEDVFDFFSRPENLAEITPAWVGYRICEPVEREIRAGTRFEYTLRLGGIPIAWRTLVRDWDAPRSFVDVQERGPYALWEHTHLVSPAGDGVLMGDVIRYALPFGPVGRLTHGVLIHSLLTRIFDYRFAKIRELFGPHPHVPAHFR